MVATARTAPQPAAALPAGIVDASVASESSGDRLYRRLWTEDLPREHGFEPLAIEGALPAELRGTLYRNGPGQFGQHGRRYSHPFEGDGTVTAVRFEGGRALGASRITSTAGLVEERAAGQIRYGLSAPWPRRLANMLRGRQKNTANTSVVLWQDRLFALMEAGRPTELDPRDLSMRGETDLGGAVVSTFSAHPHRVEARRAFYNFGIEFGRRTRLHLYELPDVGGARHLGAVELAGPPMLHDFIATETHLVFFVSPVRVAVPRMLLQVGPFQELFQWRPELGTEVICVPIDRPDQPIRFTTESFFQWHFANAFTRGGELVIDYVRYANFDSFYSLGELARARGRAALGGGSLHRAVIDTAARTLRSAPLMTGHNADRQSEFPTIAGARRGGEHGAMYLALDDLRAVGKLEHATGRLSEHALPDTQRVTEPIFVPRPGAAREDDGWVLALCHDAPTDRAFLAVYDAGRLPDGPIARAWFDHQVPITFHGAFLPQGPART
ncbi:MAG TPA: carotenoid oxygenase family protein [Kofleriaceae bacterium]|nr:carotenoid oxygenase family protein [Kofleriaceae bacterium]